MTIGIIILLAALQGVTEFLPISSDGHLRLLQLGAGIQGPQTAFDVTLHLGTLLAVFFVYRREVAAILASLGRSALRLGRGRVAGLLGDEPDTRLALVLLLANVPAGLVGVFLGDWMENAVSSVELVGVMLLLTGAFLLAGDRSSVGQGREEGRPLHAIGAGAALLIGVAQALAILRGVSRSGTTIAVALLLGVRREDAARFSFLLAIPAILGAGLLKAGDAAGNGIPVSYLLLGAAISAAVGLAALRLLVRFVRAGRLRVFAWYCAVVGVAAIVLGLAGVF